MCGDRNVQEIGITLDAAKLRKWLAWAKLGEME
jgi:hypothetical protein